VGIDLHAVEPVNHPSVTFATLTLLAVALVLILHPADTPYLDLMRRGNEHAARAERTAAVAAYQEAARWRPGDPTPYLRMAQVYLDWGRTDEALESIADAERLGADADDLERPLVAAYTARADWTAVVEHSQRWLALASASADVVDADEIAAVRHALARAYVELRQWDAARAEYETLLRTDPADSLAHERLGVLLLGDDPAAIQHLLAAETGLAARLLLSLQEPGVADDPAYASALLGRALLKEQEWALAVRQFERAISRSPNYPDAHAYLGHALDQMDYLDEAWFHLSRAAALAPDSAVIHTLLGLHYDRLGDTSTARAEYESAYDLGPDNPATCVEIGQTWAAEGRYVAAEIWLREAVSLRPDDPALWEALTRFYLNHNITADGRAVGASATLLELLPDDARAHDLRGWAALQVGDYSTAQDSLLRATALDPALASAHYHLGLLRVAQGEYQKAQETFIRALDMDTTGELIPLVERAFPGLTE